MLGLAGLLAAKHLGDASDGQEADEPDAEARGGCAGVEAGGLLIDGGRGRLVH